jgi:hypothetical protein
MSLFAAARKSRLQAIFSGQDTFPFEVGESGRTTSANQAVSDQLKVTATRRSRFEKMRFKAFRFGIVHEGVMAIGDRLSRGGDFPFPWL